MYLDSIMPYSFPQLFPEVTKASVLRLHVVISIMCGVK